MPPKHGWPDYKRAPVYLSPFVSAATCTAPVLGRARIGVGVVAGERNSFATSLSSTVAYLLIAELEESSLERDSEWALQGGSLGWMAHPG